MQFDNAFAHEPGESSSLTLEHVMLAKAMRPFNPKSGFECAAFCCISLILVRFCWKLLLSPQYSKKLTIFSTWVSVDVLGYSKPLYSFSSNTPFITLLIGCPTLSSIL